MRVFYEYYCINVFHIYHQDPPGKPKLDLFTRTYGTISPSVMSNGVVVARVGQDIRISCVMKGDKRDNGIPTYVRIKKDGIRLSSKPKKFSNQIDIVASESENNAIYECEDPSKYFTLILMKKLLLWKYLLVRLKL